MNSYKVSLVALLLATLALTSCRNETASSREVIVASIAPVKYIVEQIVGDDIPIEVLVPAGVSPETFDPSPKQLIEINEARAIMSVGLIDFEKSILKRLGDKSRLIDLSAGVELLAGSCSHDHSGTHHHHDHGVDPHIWTSPRELEVMALNCYNAIANLYPDSLHYKENYITLQSRLKRLDLDISAQLIASDIKSFVIYHPAYTYFARAYGIEQVAVEEDGKDPSARRLGEIIDLAREQRIHGVLYQTQFPSSEVAVIAQDIGVEAVAVDPLAENIIEHIEEFANIICAQQ